IPPSIPMILYAVILGTSVTRLFLTGFAPGLIGGLLMMAVVYYKARKYGFPVEEAFSLHRLGRAFRDAGWTLALPVIILGGMFGGIVTATEAYVEDVRAGRYPKPAAPAATARMT
ncbi:MAG: TRAP transporter large permease subunit, partial [Armatimonadetes bacterium]|nr:TRAP transporter large permease subunit [Armatimonadota bacterium]